MSLNRNFQNLDKKRNLIYLSNFITMIKGAFCTTPRKTSAKLSEHYVCTFFEYLKTIIYKMEPINNAVTASSVGILIALPNTNGNICNN